MRSRAYGTESFPCATLEQAVEKLSRLARYADEDRRNDGIQRAFSIVEADATPKIPPDTLVIFIESGCVHWVACDLPELRVFILDADADHEQTTPAACWEEGPRSLAEIDANLLAVLRCRGADCGRQLGEEARP